MSTTNKTGSDPTPPHRLGQEGNAGVSSANDDDLVSSTGHGTGMDENMLNKDGLAPKKGFAQKLKEMF